MRKFALMPAAMMLAFWPGPATAEMTPAHRIVDPAEIQWAAGPAALPGSKSAVLYGDPSKPELFVMRLWMPANFRVPPHTHPMPEIVTVVSGAVLLGMGTDGDRAKARRLPAGSFASMEPNTPHYGFTDEETVLQISTTGPWAINFVNPADDPRTKAPTAQERGR